MNKGIRIGGALVLGIVMVGGAFFLRASGDAEEEQFAITVAEPARTYIPKTDTDGDGTPDWEEELQAATLRAAKDAPEIDIENASGTQDTLTAAFARSFFESYLTEGGASGDSLAQEALIAGAMSDLAQNAEDDPITLNDIITGSDDTAALREYGNRIAAAVSKNSADLGTENEADIFIRYAETNSEEDKQALEAIRNSYAALLSETLLIAAPPQLIHEHLALVNAYQAIRNDITGMIETHADPLHALLRLQRYQSDALVLYESVSALYSTLYNMGVRYATDEPGAMFSPLIR